MSGSGYQGWNKEYCYQLKNRWVIILAKLIEGFVMSIESRHSGMFKPGQSGNPTCRPKVDVSIRDLAKTYTISAIETLASIMQNPKASSSTRVNAACALLDRGWGKPAIQLNSIQVGMSYENFLDQLAAKEFSLSVETL